MLSLSRKVGEVVMVGEHGAIVVLEISRDGVRLGFEFPKDVKLVRSEIAVESSPAARRCIDVMRARKEDAADARAAHYARTYRGV